MASENLGGWVPGYNAGEEQVWTFKEASSSLSAFIVPFTPPNLEIRIFSAAVSSPRNDKSQW